MSRRYDILCVVDCYDWAFFRIAEKIKEYYSPHGFSVKIVDIDDLQKKRRTAKAVVCFWWGYGSLVKSFVDYDKMIVCVYDHLTWKNSPQSFEKEGCTDADFFVVANKKLAEELSVSQPIFVCEDGVDTSFFKPKRDSERDKFTVGWAGNSSVFSASVKGLDLLQDACKKIGVPLKIADRKHSRLPFGEMPDFWNSVSAGVFPSLSEGTPNPLLECLACGRPVAITDVGLSRGIIDGSNGVIIKERKIDSVVNSIISLMKMDYRLACLNARLSVAPFDWNTQIESWREVFAACG